MRPFADGAAPCRKRAPLSPMMETPEAPDAKIPSELEASKFIEYPRQAYITICGTKAVFSHHCTGRLQVAFQKAAVVLGVSGVGPRSTSPNRAPWSPLGRLRLSCVGITARGSAVVGDGFLKNADVR